jgi:CheY-like chemotaxis protein
VSAPSVNPEPPQPLLLIVEDEQALRDALVQLLEPVGCRVVAVERAEEALASAAELRPDAILLDLVLPTLDGIEVARLLQSDPRTSDIPLIAATASWLGERGDLLSTAGFAGALRKPFGRGPLLEELRRVLPGVPLDCG